MIRKVRHLIEWEEINATDIPAGRERSAGFTIIEGKKAEAKKRTKKRTAEKAKAVKKAKAAEKSAKAETAGKTKKAKQV